MHDFLLMTKVNSTQDLFNDCFALLLIDNVVFGMDELFEIVLVIIEYDLQVLLCCFVDDLS